jgi:DNA-binding LytR/AlgR family response regulator
MAKVRIMIVEDELLIAEEMASRLESFGYSVVTIVDSAADARHALETYQVDMILIDIKIKGDEDGISLGAYVTQRYAIPLIYITSLKDQPTIDRSKSSRPSAYLIKPYNDQQLQIVIDMALYNYSADRSDREKQNHDNKHHVIKDSFFIRHNDRYVRIHLDDITYLEADNNYSKINTADTSIMIPLTLGAVLDKLPVPGFLRVHRSFVVNVRKVQAFEGNRLYIGKVEIPVGRNYSDRVFTEFPSL